MTLPNLPLLLQLETTLASLTRLALLPSNMSSPSFGSASLPWSNHWSSNSTAPVPPSQLPALAQAVEQLLRKRTRSLSEGIRRYQAAQPKVSALRGDVVWQNGSARLLRTLPAKPPRTPKRPIFCVPSLINRANILDLLPGFSLIEALNEAGHAVYLLDWGEPRRVEDRFSAADYVRKHLLPALGAALHDARLPPLLFGYCMGGVLALAAAQLAPSSIAGLALLATPWDFSALRSQQWMPHQLAQLQQWVRGQKRIGPELLDRWFYLQQPWSVHAKLRQLAALPEDAPTTDAFLAAEAWLHDGVPLVPGVAEDGWIHWAYHNQLAQAQWNIGAATLDAARIPHAALVICPREDTIVPNACSRPLASALPNATLLEPQTGHIGTLVGQKRHQWLWKPLLEHASVI